MQANEQNSIQTPNLLDLLPRFSSVLVTSRWEHQPNNVFQLSSLDVNYPDFPSRKELCGEYSAVGYRWPVSRSDPSRTSSSSEPLPLVSVRNPQDVRCLLAQKVQVSKAGRGEEGGGGRLRVRELPRRPYSLSQSASYLHQLQGALLLLRCSMAGIQPGYRVGV